jgi:hypothetical protein
MEHPMQPEPVLPASPELTEQVRIIENEAEFATFKPRRPYHWWPLALSGVLAVGIGITAYLSWRAHPEKSSEGFWFFMFFVMQFLVQVGQYISQRQLFRMHMLACDIIAYYKKKTPA